MLSRSRRCPRWSAWWSFLPGVLCSACASRASSRTKIQIPNIPSSREILEYYWRSPNGIQMVDGKILCCWSWRARNLYHTGNAVLARLLVLFWTVSTLGGSSALVRLLVFYHINALLIVLYWSGCWYCAVCVSTITGRSVVFQLLVNCIVSTRVGSFVLVQLLVMYHINTCW